ncbi:IQ domain-containing protein IQM6 [Malania oleifera]|uniref:IQ domain-containing protein IQM6 n=1 Tax=Malania oleifera TaxID=397392 RepID=UPI0025ADFF79|nr:IQ domain-containing protein IQM6 [Malania oleifera]
MGANFSCPSFDDLDSQFDAVLMRSISFGNDDHMDGPFRSISFNGRDSEPVIMRSYCSGKMIFEGSLSFKARELETMMSIKTPSSAKENKVFVQSLSFNNKDVDDDQSPTPDSVPGKKPPSAVGNHRYQAALKLQKVYKSFRTRRQLADCAVLVEQKWWKLLDFAELKRSSISFFDIEKPETAVSRWSRARTRAAKVGKGLSKDEKARKLALQHWLEAIDPRHRYGHNLQFYYVKWLHCDSKQPFFYWLDIGEGKEVNLVDRCPRTKLQQQCIKYLGPTEREAYEVDVENGKFFNKQTGKLLDTTGGPKDAKWIFVLSTSKTLYVGLKNKGTFQHSSFLAGGATLAAGRLVVEDGILKAVWPHSGHYLPTEENFQEFMSFLMEHNVDLANVKKNPTDEEEESSNKKGSRSFHQRNSSKRELYQDAEGTDSRNSAQDETNSGKQDANAVGNPELPKSRLSRRFCSKIARLKIPEKNDVVEMFKEELPPGPSCTTSTIDSPSDDGYETAEESFLSEEDFIVAKMNLFGEDDENNGEEEPPITKETILQRINSHRRTKSYQLAQRLSSKWTTGAGPRIGCMRDYPSRLQFRVLEQANLSPRLSRSKNARGFCQNVLTPTIFSEERIALKQKHQISMGRSSLASVQGILSQTRTP